MKAFIYSVISLLLVTVVIAAIPTESEAAIYEDTVRLHILARSDDEGDQKIKLEVRDRILEKYGTELGSLTSACDAERELSVLLPEIENSVDAWLEELGCDYTSRVTLGEEWYNTREYESFTLPSGLYTSLIIELGGGGGKNWWCVMYPPMCLDIAKGESVDTERPDYTREETNLISGGKYRVKFKLLEIMSAVAKEISNNG